MEVGQRKNDMKMTDILGLLHLAMFIFLVVQLSGQIWHSVRFLKMDENICLTG